MPDGNIKVLVEGVERAKSIEVNDRDGFFVATVRTGKTDFEMTPAVEQLMQRVTSLFEQYVKLQQSLNYETIIATVRMDEPAKLSDTIAANLQLGIEEKQELLGIFDPAARLARIADVLDVEIEKLDLDRNIQSRVKRQMERAQKEYYLNEKIKAIQKELGRGEKSEFDELRKKIEAAGMPKEDARQSDPGAQEARSHAAHVGRIHRQPQLHRLAARRAVEEKIQRNALHRLRRKSAQRRPLRP